MKRLSVNYEFDEKYENNPEFDEALTKFLKAWGWEWGGSGLNLIKHERDLYFKKENE